MKLYDEFDVPPHNMETYYALVANKQEQSYESHRDKTLYIFSHATPTELKKICKRLTRQICIDFVRRASRRKLSDAPLERIMSIVGFQSQSISVLIERATSSELELIYKYVCETMYGH